MALALNLALPGRYLFMPEYQSHAPRSSTMQRSKIIAASMAELFGSSILLALPRWPALFSCSQIQLDPLECVESVAEVSKARHNVAAKEL